LHQRVGPKADGLYGYAVDGAGDWNDDGTPDVVAGAIDYTKVVFTFVTSEAGYADVFSGSNGALLAFFTGTNEHDSLGASVAGAGDVDGSGLPDVVAGLDAADTSVLFGGKVDVFSAETGALQFSASGTAPAGSLGFSVDGGDFDGDGFADVVA